MTAVASEKTSSAKLSRPPGDESPVKANRNSTDVLFAILIFLSWVAMSIIGAYVCTKGNYRILYYPRDYAGNVCGLNYAANTLNVSDYPKIVYVNSYGGGVCVKECPNVTQLVDTQTLITYAGVYQGSNPSLPPNYVDMPDYASAYNVSNYTCNPKTCPTGTNFSYYSTGIKMGYGYAFYAMDTVEIFGGRCFVTPNAMKELKQQVFMLDINPSNSDFINKQYEFWKNLYADLYTAKEFIFGFGFGVALVISFLYSNLLRIKGLVQTMVWTSIFVTIVAVFALGTYLYKIAGTWAEQDPQLHSKTFINGTKIASYVIFAIGALLFSLIIYLRKEIHLAVALIKTAASSIGSMPMIVTFPIFQSALYIVFVVAWIYYVANLASMGKVVPKEYSTGLTNVSVNTYQFDKLTWELAWYLLFALFWTTTFIGAMGQLIIAMCAARWYFTRDKSKINSGTVWSSMCIVLRYHTGTAAFGSLIIAIILLIRAILMYFQKKAEQMNKRIAGILFCCCQCCLWCFQKCMEFINKNAYIYTAMFGTPFCKSAREGFGLIVRNAARVGTLSYVSVMIVFIGRLFISTATAGASWVIMQHYIGKDLYSLAGPTVVILIIAYHVADMFMQVFNMTASTILHCFVADEEMYESAEQYATGDLRDYIEKNENRARKLLKVVDEPKNDSKAQVY